jgi:hypothetical protein
MYLRSLPELMKRQWMNIVKRRPSCPEKAALCEFVSQTCLASRFIVRTDTSTTYWGEDAALLGSLCKVRPRQITHSGLAMKIEL